MLALLGRVATPNEVDRIHQRSGGLPLFTEQLAAQSAEEEALPRLLADLLDGRFAGISHAEWAIARALGVADRPLTDAQLRSLTGLSPAALTAGLHALDEQFLITTGVHEVRLRHPLFAEAVRRRLVAGEAADEHRRLALTLAESPRPSAAEVAEHWQRADDPEQEILWRIRAAQEAGARFALAHEAEQWRRALELWPDDADLRRVARRTQGRRVPCRDRRAGGRRLASGRPPGRRSHAVGGRPTRTERGRGLSAGGEDPGQPGQPGRRPRARGSRPAHSRCGSTARRLRACPAHPRAAPRRARSDRRGRGRVRDGRRPSSRAAAPVTARASSRALGTPSCTASPSPRKRDTAHGRSGRAGLGARQGRGSRRNRRTRPTRRSVRRGDPHPHPDDHLPQRRRGRCRGPPGTRGCGTSGVSRTIPPRCCSAICRKHCDMPAGCRRRHS